MACVMHNLALLHRSHYKFTSRISLSSFISHNFTILLLKVLRNYGNITVQHLYSILMKRRHYPLGAYYFADIPKNING